MRKPVRPLLVAAVGTLMTSAVATALTIQFDYTYDTAGFFGQQSRRDLMNQAASTFTGFADSLSAITPTSQDTWTPKVYHPATGSQFDLPTRSIPANTLVIYAGARDLPSGVLGEAGPGWYSASGYQQSWFDTLRTRGQAGATTSATTSTDFGPWGGSIAFDTNSNWFFGSATSGLDGSESDFLSVAIHELAHVLGFGTSYSFKHYINAADGTFTGAASVARHGRAVQLNSERAHWVDGTGSKINGLRSQETAMDPSIYAGTRKVFTDLDYAGMTDIGWQVRLPGDANADDKVNADDYLLIDRGFRRGLTGWCNGDFNADGSVTAADYLIIDRAYTAQSGAPEPLFLAERESQFGAEYLAQLLGTSVPEPSAALAGLSSLLFLVARCRR